MTEHTLKCTEAYFDAIERGDKNFEVRRDDRGFQKGDTLVLERFHPSKGYTGALTTFGIKLIRKTVTYILTGGQFGIEPGYVVMGLADPAEHPGTISETTTRTPTRTPNADGPQATEPQR